MAIKDEIIDLNDDDADDDEEGDDDDDDDDFVPDPYQERAASEFLDEKKRRGGGGLRSDVAPPSVGRSSLDWGGAYGKLSERIGDVESGKTGPSDALFRIMSSESPSQAIGSFVNEADPGVVQAMSGAVGSLLGGLSNPNSGVETIVKATKDKLGNLCFQLQMTGYMFRNAEYVLALKDIMNIRGSATLDDYRAAFDRIDGDGSGYIEAGEIEALLEDVYGDKGEKAPAFEVETFLQFFDSDNDGRISWEEFEDGLGAAYAAKIGNDRRKKSGAGDVSGTRGPAGLLGGDAHGESGSDDDIGTDDEDDEEEEYDLFGEPSVSGTIEVELESGKVITVSAEDYIDEMKREAEALKAALLQEAVRGAGRVGVPEDVADAGGALSGLVTAGGDDPSSTASKEAGGVAGYISSLQGDVKVLTEGISPEVVDAMKLLINFVLEGGPGGGDNKAGKKEMSKDAELELPGSALKQLALWQLVLGYRLREAEATGDYRKMLES